MNANQVKLKRILIRYFPPGLILEFEIDGQFKSRHIDLLELELGFDHTLTQVRILLFSLKKSWQIIQSFHRANCRF